MKVPASGSFEIGKSGFFATNQMAAGNVTIAAICHFDAANFM
jgi:hypothetical protein